MVILLVVGIIIVVIVLIVSLSLRKAEKQLSKVRECIAKYQGRVFIKDDHIVIIDGDGTVVAMGDNEYGQCNVSDWRDIVAVADSSSHSVGLKADGTVVVVGKNFNGEYTVSQLRQRQREGQ